jgi:hypothetical protein
MSDLRSLYVAQDRVARWSAESENASARLELARMEERMAYLISQHEPVHSLQIDREVLRTLLTFVRHGRGLPKDSK